MNCLFCSTSFEKPRRKFCSHECACSHRKGTVKRRGPNTGKCLKPSYRRDSQRRRRGWTEEQIETGVMAASDKYAAARLLGYRSMYEVNIVKNAEDKGLSVEYEPFKIPYLLEGNYLPDFVLPNGIVVEAKGHLDSRARAKMIAVKKHNPLLDIRFVFMNSKTKLRKGSKLTYADWCSKYGFTFADGMIPLEWFNEQTLSENL